MIPLIEQLEEIKYLLEGKMTMGDLFKSQPGDDPDPAQGQRDIHHAARENPYPPLKRPPKPMSKKKHKKLPKRRGSKRGVGRDRPGPPFDKWLQPKPFKPDDPDAPKYTPGTL